ncbi:MAG: hypothetical protein E6I57_14250 [Chloroflexi bacterium]|nr:MAG: hypothetical protein E6I57_14250 [Chloroflexota bacterium]
MNAIALLVAEVTWAVSGVAEFTPSTLAADRVGNALPANAVAGPPKMRQISVVTAARHEVMPRRSLLRPI